MSYGLVVCSECRRELHQSGDHKIERGWIHCEDKTPRCIGATTDSVESATQIRGKYCGADDLDGLIVPRAGR